MRRRNPASTPSGMARDTVWSLANEGCMFLSMTLAFFLLSTPLGRVGLGAYTGLFGVIGPLTAVTNGGAALSMLQHLVQLREKPLMTIRSIIATVLVLGVSFAALASTITLLWIPGIAAAAVILITVNELVIGATNYVLTASVQAIDGFVPSARLRIGSNLLRIAVLVSLWAFGKLTLVPYALLTFVVAGAYTIFLLRHVGRLRGGRIVGGPIHRVHLRSIATYSSGLTGMAVQNDGDKIAMPIYGWKDDAGRYGAAYRLVQMGLMPITALVGATHVSFLDTESQVSQLHRARKLALISVAYGAFVGVVLWFAAPLVPKILSEFDNTPTMIRWLCPLILLRGTGTFAMNGLLGLGYNKLRTWLLVGNAGFAALLYGLLVWRHSWKGAVAATLSSEVTLMVAAWTCLIVLQRRQDSRRLAEVAISPSDVRQAESDVMYGEH